MPKMQFNDSRPTGTLDPSTTLIRVTDVCRMTSLSRSSVYKRLKEDSTFPRPVSLTDSAARGAPVAWVLGEVQTWVRSRVERRTTARIEG